MNQFLKQLFVIVNLNGRNVFVTLHLLLFYCFKIIKYFVSITEHKKHKNTKNTIKKYINQPEKTYGCVKTYIKKISTCKICL